MIFECVGIPGMIDGIITGAPLFSRIVVVGVCMEPDRIRPAMAINKEIDLRFVVGYTPLEFRDTLHMLAEGKVDAGPMVTGTVGLVRRGGRLRRARRPRDPREDLIDPKRAGDRISGASDAFVGYDTVSDGRCNLAAGYGPLPR